MSLDAVSDRQCLFLIHFDWNKRRQYPWRHETIGHKHSLAQQIPE